MTASDLARRIGATKAQIVAYENGRTVPDPKRVAELARALNVEPARLMRTWKRTKWTVADLRRATALTASEVTVRLRVSAKAYRRFEQYGVVPAQRRLFLDDLADILGVSNGAVKQAMDNIPAVVERRDRGHRIARTLVDQYVHDDRVWKGPRAKDELLSELAALYGRSAQRLRPVLTHLLGQLRQRAVLVERERVVAEYDTDPVRRQRAYTAWTQHSSNFNRELAQVGTRLESYYRDGQPSDVWQAIVDLYELGARPSGVWVPLSLLASDETAQSLPRPFVKQQDFGDLVAAQLTQPGVSHLHVFRHLYAALYPAVRKPAAPGSTHSSPGRGQLPDNHFTLPGITERFAVPQPVMTRLQADADLRGTAGLPLSPTMTLVFGPTTHGSVPRPRPRPAETTPPQTIDPGTAQAPAEPEAAPPTSPVMHPGTESDALRRARLAHTVVDVLEKHPVGVESARIGRAAGIPAAELAPLLAMLCEEEFAVAVAADVYAPGPALDRLASPGGVWLQIQHTLALARDTVGAAVYYSRYVDGEVQITQLADSPITPRVNQWVDFKAAAHASAVGKALLNQLPPGMRADHLSRHRTARLTRRTITNPRLLIDTLDRIAPGQPVYDLREYANKVVCGAIGASTSTEIGTLALSLPLASAHRLEAATRALAQKAVPVLLALLIAETIPAQGPGDTLQASEPTSSNITQAGIRRLHAVFRTPLTAPRDIQNVALTPAPGPHLATDSASSSLYLFEAPAEPADITDPSPGLVLPHTYMPIPTARPTAFTTTPHTTWQGHEQPDRLLIFRSEQASDRAH
ncbi:IclR family transcriptional regulator C-terminal domain-containing protein [Streptomyces sp. NPDC060031]|uniref:helix-turn-helix domain-containing protein n=1 Tax=Streptomyces sp. NPDC060031 TaxID=3347043 RepID=UPI003682A8A6